MARLHDAVKSYLAQQDWPYEDRTDYFIVPVAGQSGAWTAYFELRENAQQVVVYSMIPFRIPDPRLTAIAVFLTRANYGLAIGNFELDLDDGEVRYKTSVDVEGAALEQPLIDHLFLANIVTVDRYLRAMEAVVDGADPTAAVLGVDQPASD